ncbi:putative OPT family oligopeptide transporter [Anaerospora hongkongensis]|uniref:Putative OPT family oligopeptide transporter n=1 Tax=Anaerospora hongkongensis TaxID=244830 RepID=A0A4R1PLI2_9FIRM|nr:oligopeptide transporter, OPT family [Anaerospora hongkongensis]TCL31418.1 putative OPT family oligopeptide transporter [Anaerospora hongkongensis]
MSSEERRLDYLNVSGREYAPYVAADKVIPEFTATAIIMGAVLAIIFGMANAYLGLKAGMTVSATIPAAVISMGLLKGVLKRGTVLENTVAQSIASSGEAVAAGMIFTVPAFFLWGYAPDMMTMTIMALLGGSLGVLLMIPLRRYLIVDEHANLPYPEGTACAEVLVVGDQGGTGAKTVFAGIGIGAGYKFLMGALGIWEENPEWAIPGLKGAAIGFDVLPALMGVGFIIGPRAAFTMFAGSILSWLVLMPLISYFGSGLTTPVFPATTPISEMDHWALWSKYIRYIGAGGVAVGGMFSLLKSMPTIISSFKASMSGLTKGGAATAEDSLRTQKDMPVMSILIGTVIIFLACAFLPQLHMGVIGAIMVVVFGFFFTTVSSRIVGLIGSSSNPVSGMTIGTLILVSVLLKAMGYTGTEGMLAALSIGALVCISIAMAGDTSQDLKTAFLIGATPYRQQYALLIGVVASAAVIGWTLMMLNSAYGFGTKELAAPQATLMSLVVKGVIDGSLPWALVGIGAFVAVVAELLGISVLAFAVGMYLPIHLNAAIAVGGLLSLILTKTVKHVEELKKRTEEGILLASGLIAGDSLMGVVLALLVYENVDMSLGMKWGGFVNEVSMGIFVVLALGFLRHCLNFKWNKENE